MKKILTVMIMVILGGVMMVNLPKITAVAETTTENIDAAIEIVEDTTYSNIKFVVSADNNLVQNFNIVSGTLTLNDCHITSASSAGVMTTIFNVGEAGRLVLNNVTIENIGYNKCITNSGIVDITNTTFTNAGKSIENNSSKENSINYYSGNLGTVKLNSGYISVYENTVINQNINVELKSTAADRTLVVRSVGENVFASKYIDKFSYSGDNGYFLDYIGDGATVKDASGKVDLSAGDIVLTTMSLSFVDKNTYEEIPYSPMYCTAYNFLKTSDSLYYSNTDGVKRAMDNYSANVNESATFVARSASKGNLFTVDINCIVRNGQTDTIKSTKKVTYQAGSSYAVFVDIPSGYEFDATDKNNIEILEGTNETTVITLSDSLSINSYYMRPILLCDATNSANWTTKNFTVNLIFKEKVKNANITVTENYGVSLVSNGIVAVGGDANLILTCAEDEVITGITVNGETVAFTKNETGYLFTVENIQENNVIDTEIKHIVNITPAPEVLSFEYGSEIELKQNYTVAKTGEVLEIEYTAADTDVGSYSITEIKSCDKDNYIINVVGDIEYTVTKKQIDISTIATKPYRVQYSKNITVECGNFLVNELPSYLKAEMQNISEFVGGEQSLRMSISVKDSERYIIVGERDYITVVLDIIPMEINISNFVLNNNSAEYTGSKVELLASGYDTEAVTVTSLYYLSGNETTPVDPIAVGTYTVKLSVVANSSVYSVVGSKSATLSITAKNIDLTSYLTAIEVTQFEYDGQEKYINLKEDLLPEHIALSVDSQEKQINAGIYYYTVSFSTDSANYTCTESSRVALIINAKIVTISLATAVFDYTGNIPNLVVNVSGVVGQDAVTAVFETVPVSTVGTHKITVLRLSNTNYAIATPVEFEYTINSIAVDMTGVEFKNISVTYDGQAHKPVLTGTLPLGITYNITTTDNCTSAGVHNVKCTFVSNNEGIVAPSPMFATVTISPKELIVVYTEPTNMVANGEKKSILIEFVGLVDGETVNYSTTYSADPILAGEYTCKVKLLEENNYVLKSDAPYRFIVFMSSISYSEDGLNLSVKGKFSSKENLTISKVNSKIEIVNLLSNLSIKDYLAINMSCVNYQDEPMTVVIDVKDIAEELKYLKVYRVKDNKLEAVEYTSSGNIISFVSNCNEEIIFVEEHTYTYMHRVEIAVIIGLAVTCLALTIVIACVSKKSKKKNK